MNTNLIDFVEKNYDIVYGKNNLQDCKFFFLSEDHLRLSQRILNNEFIDKFATFEDILLLERIPSGEECPDLTKNWQTAFLKNRIKSMGWDAGYFHELMSPELNEEHCQLLLELERLNDELTLLHMNNGSSTEISSIRKRFSELARTIPNNCSEIMEQKIEETFQKRTASMMRTLSKVESIRGKVFLIAGEKHLQEVSWIKNPQYSLEIFMNYLTNKKAVILIPKEVPGQCSIQ